MNDVRKTEPPIHNMRSWQPANYDFIKK